MPNSSWNRFSIPESKVTLSIWNLLLIFCTANLVFSGFKFSSFVPEIYFSLMAQGTAMDAVVSGFLGDTIASHSQECSFMPRGRSRILILFGIISRLGVSLLGGFFRHLLVHRYRQYCCP